MKIFAVGLNKTGTMSLDKVLKPYFKTLHNPNVFTEMVSKAIKNRQKPLKYLNPNICLFSDLFWASNMSTKFYTDQVWRSLVVKYLYRDYPNAKFIINIRNLNDWLASRVKHVKRNQNNKRYSEKTYQWTKIDEQKWIQEYIDHYKFLDKFFGDKPHLKLDICAGDKPDKLFDFLGIKSDLKEFPIVNQYK